MKGKAALLAGAAIGYVLGARAGRERYETIKDQAGSAAARVRRDPRVQDGVQQAKETARAKAGEAVDAAKQAVDDVRSDDGRAADTGPSGAQGPGIPPAGGPGTNRG